MCGRYRLSRRKQLVEEYFDALPGDEEWMPRYNIAPTQPIPVIRQNPKEPRRELSLMRWGLFAFAGFWDRWKDPSGQWLKCGSGASSNTIRVEILWGLLGGPCFRIASSWQLLISA
jgi:putative SOS response-associated peptidase YedK